MLDTEHGVETLNLCFLKCNSYGTYVFCYLFILLFGFKRRSFFFNFLLTLNILYCTKPTFNSPRKGAFNYTMGEEGNAF